ncbi:hypothetical protein CRUP_004021 [Coryphaenoides rupestris]|nr:hypothetical protein CRUP_004021 [Coryphaenoides rupestris]
MKLSSPRKLLVLGTPSSLSCSMAGVRSLGNSVGVQMYRQQLRRQHRQQHLQQQFRRGMRPAVPPHPARRPARPYPGHPPYAEGTDVGAVPCVYQDYRVRRCGESDLT